MNKVNSNSIAGPLAAVGGPNGRSAPRVSIVVPARDEERKIRRCLESLVAQRVVGGAAGESQLDIDITVVDDDSRDATRSIAEQFAGVKVIAAKPLAEGWTGKCNAMQSGSEAARGEWILFTDADTVHAPGSLSAAVREAEEAGADILSYSPRQEARGLVQQAVMPLVFAELARTYPTSAVSDPANPAAAANGQYLLVRRRAYQALGGHGAVRRSVLEDVAFAKLAKQAGMKIRFRYSDAVSTRMYDSWARMREGWTRNLAALFPRTLELADKRLAEAVAIAGGVVAGVALWLGSGLTASSGARGIVAGRDGLTVVAASIALALGIGCYAAVVARTRAAHFSMASNLLAPLGLPLFVYLLVRSDIHYRQKRVVWKGREYQPEPRDSSETAVPSGLEAVSQDFESETKVLQQAARR